jgi:hypothetical protein
LAASTAGYIDSRNELQVSLAEMLTSPSVVEIPVSSEFRPAPDRNAKFVKTLRQGNRGVVDESLNPESNSVEPINWVILIGVGSS